MKKRISAFLLGVALCLSLVGTAFAAEPVTVEFTAGKDALTVSLSGLGKSATYALGGLLVKRQADKSFALAESLDFVTTETGTYTGTFKSLAGMTDGDQICIYLPGVTFTSADTADEKDANDGSLTHTFKNEIRIQITFDLNYTGASKPVSFYLDDPDITPPSTTRTGWKFTGWYTAQEGGKQVSIPDGLNSLKTDTILYAHWEKVEEPAGPVTGVTLDKTLSVRVDRTATLTAILTPTNGEHESIDWESKDPTIAKVAVDKDDDTKATVTGVKEGETEIVVTVVSTNGTTYTATCTVTVTKASSQGGGGGGGGGGPAVRPNGNTGTTTPTTPETPEAPSFTDVPANYTFASDIAFVASKGWMGGYGNGEFRPYANTSRQALWMVLARISGASPANMAEARAWAMDNGISDGSRPTGAMSRQQMVTMLYRFAQMQGYRTSGGTDFSSFTDAGTVASYAQEAMSWAIGNGIVGGNNGALTPENSAIRAHFAAFLHRFCNSVGID